MQKIERATLQQSLAPLAGGAAKSTEGINQVNGGNNVIVAPDLPSRSTSVG